TLLVVCQLVTSHFSFVRTCVITAPRIFLFASVKVIFSVFSKSECCIFPLSFGRKSVFSRDDTRRHCCVNISSFFVCYFFSSLTFFQNDGFISSKRSTWRNNISFSAKIVTVIQLFRFSIFCQIAVFFKFIHCSEICSPFAEFNSLNPVYTYYRIISVSRMPQV